MKFIGITGGAGAGKSAILKYMEEHYPARILLADELAHELMLPGSKFFDQIKETFRNEEIFLPQGGIDAGKFAEIIFSDDKKRMQLNKIVHPAVKKEILKQVEEERKKNRISYFILEAALLIEEGYDKICDELWYIDTSEANRRKRLKISRGYSDAKIDAIFSSQLSAEEYKKYCKTVIDNNGLLDETFDEIDKVFDRDRNEEKRNS